MTTSTLSGVYKITNIITGKIYIGSTKNLSTRWNLHMSPRSNCTKLKQSIKKHGVQNFSIELVEPIDITEMAPSVADTVLKEREQYYLDILQPFDTTGYNIQHKSNGVHGTPHTTEYKLSISGHHSAMAKRVRMYDTNGTYLKTYSTISEAAKDHHPASVQTIIRCCKNKAITTGGRMWGYEDQEPPHPRVRYKGMKVAQLNQTGDIIQIFNSVKEASEASRCTSSNIVDCCKGRIKKSKSGSWKYYKT